MELRAGKVIIQSDHSALRLKAHHVATKDIGSKEIKKLIENMRKLLAHESNGVGLAACQVGVPIQLFIVAGRVFEEGGSGGDTSKQDKVPEESPPDSLKPHPLDRVFINPELTRQSRKKKDMSEGCLSVRGIFGTVLRHEKVSLKALDDNGETILVNASGLLAHIFQHEVDHLNGVLFIDKAVSLEPIK